MSRKAIVTQLKLLGTGQFVGAEVGFTNSSDTNIVDPQQFDIDISGITTPEAFIAAVKAAITAHSTTNSYGITDVDIIWVVPKLPAGLNSAPQAAIANAPADAVTNYNVVTTLLGALTGAVNTANTKQNEIATKLNTLLAELRTLGLISA